MKGYVFFVVTGFLSGAVLYSYLLPKLFCGVDVVQCSDDANPGTSNAVKYAGWGIGLLCLLLDLLKGFVPVFWAMHRVNPLDPLFSVVIAAPVFGHAFSPFLRGRGGKAIAVSFGVLLAVAPITPLFYILVCLFLFFSGILVIRPHRIRVMVVFGLLALYCLSRPMVPVFQYAGLLVCATVVYKHLISSEPQKVQISFLKNVFQNKKAS